MLTQELGVAVAPAFDNAVLERLELMQAGADRLLMILVLKGGAARTIFMEVRSLLPSDALATVSGVLNERLSGLSLREVRATVRDRLRDAAPDEGAKELLNIFVEEADQIFDIAGAEGGEVMLGSTQMLAEQPEFLSNRGMRTLLELTERRDVLREALAAREAPGLEVRIGAENTEPKLSTFTIVTSNYQCGPFTGVIGVMGPTRMPYEKIVTLVEYTSRLVGNFLE